MQREPTQAAIPGAKPWRVLHVLGTADVAGTGVASMVRTLARRLDASEFELTACFLGQHGVWSERLRAVGVTVFEVPWSSPSELGGAYRFWQLLRSLDLDLVHLHYGGRAVRRLARLATDARLIVHAHGRVRSEQNCTPIALNLQDADAVIATSRAVADVVRAERVRVVYPGVAAVQITSRRAAWTIGAAGRLVPIKGYDRLLAAFAMVKAIHPEVRLEIAGDGPSRADLEKHARSLRLGESIRFLGWVDGLTDLMMRWSVLAQPSLEEALGITVLQAMACGLPVVASNVGGLPEVVGHQITGLLVAPGEVSLLADALTSILARPDRQALLGEAGRRRAEAFSEERFVESVAETYRDMLLSGRASNRS